MPAINACGSSACHTPVGFGYHCYQSQQDLSSDSAEDERQGLTQQTHLRRNWSRACSALASNRKAEIVCAKCGVQSFLRYDHCRKCSHALGFLFLPGHAPPQGPALPWEQCKLAAQQNKQLPASLPPVPAPAAPPNSWAAKQAPALGIPMQTDGTAPTWETSLADLSAGKLKEEITRLQTLRSHLELFQCTASLAEIDLKLSACRKALTDRQPEGQRLEQLKASLKRAKAAKDKADTQLMAALQAVEDAKRKVEECSTAVTEANAELEAFRSERQSLEHSESAIGSDTQRNMLAAALAERVSNMVATAREKQQELSNSQVTSAFQTSS